MSPRARQTAMKAAGLALCLLAAFAVGFVMGVDRGYDTGHKMGILKVRDALKEGHADQRTFRLTGMDELVFYPWAKGKTARDKALSIAGAGDQGMRRVTP